MRHHRPNRDRFYALAAGLVALIAVGPVAIAQQDPAPAVLSPLSEAEREVRRIFATFFKRTRNPDMHERGWVELERHLPDTRLTELLLELFGGEPIELRSELLHRFAEAVPDHADVILAWAAVFGEDAELRTVAAGRLLEIVGQDEPSRRVQVILSEGLKDSDSDTAIAAAELVQAFNLLRAVPMLAQAQAQPRQSENAVRRGALAQIVVGSQQAFVQDLTPVVATNAVGFQPTIGVVTNGVVLRVLDAVVWEYRTPIHRSLVEMTTAATGDATSRFGYDTRAWRDWYAAVLEPRLDAEGK
ncbi:MAG: hypothetical protein AAGB48_11385 [Planctomycetota bacterium]